MFNVLLMLIGGSGLVILGAKLKWIPLIIIGIVFVIGAGTIITRDTYNSHGEIKTFQTIFH